jgi:hypothetical protein
LADACSNATLKGTFAFTSSGLITSPAALAGPFADVGTQTFDGTGTTTATATASNGAIIPLTVTGTYVQQRPEVSIAHSSWKLFKSFCAEWDSRRRAG